MKSVWWIVLVLWATAYNLYGQQPGEAPLQEPEVPAAQQKYQFGVKAGVNFAELFGDDAIPQSDRKIGYSAGLYANFKISNDFKIQPEVIWSVQGEKSKSKGRYSIAYVNIPVMFKWINKKFYAEVGPQLGLLTINTSQSVPDSIRLENFETFDLAINAGVGYEVFKDW